MFGIDKALRKLEKAVDHLTKPIPPLHEAEQALAHLAAGLAKRYNDYLNGERTGIEPLRGGTNWDAYHHSQLYAFVHVDASPQQVLAQVEAWLAHADGLRSKGDAVGKQWESVRAAWRGAAAQLAGTRAQDIRDHSNAAADWTTDVARQLGLVADALGTAKARMPPPPDHPLANVLEGSAVAGLEAAPAGPFAMGVQSVATAGFGTFEQHRKNLEAKKRAVHVMQDYEKVIIGREFRPAPSAVDYQTPDPDDRRTGGSPAPQRLSTAAAAVPAVPAVGSTTPAATAGIPDGTPGPGNAVPPGPGPGTAPAAAVVSSRTAPDAASPARRPGFAPGSWRSFASGGRTGGYPGVGLPDLAFGGADPRAGQGLAGERGGRAGSARGGLAGAGDGRGPFNPAGRGRKRGDDDKEHVNTLPQGHNLFDAGLVVGPAVIGGDDDR